MGADRHLLLAQRIDQVGEIQQQRGHGVIGIGRPGAVAMAAQIRGDHVPVGGQFARDPVHRMGMVEAAVLQDQRRRIRVAPVEIVQAQGLAGEVAETGRGHRSSRQNGARRRRRQCVRPTCAT
jgi:hypothetical protein